ncbi:MAG TPA: membrane protein insertase YidC, partial [Rhizobiaceae bacterium]|nr:membrane protein insertase YidC [Rhizobiaceae bacterium]
MDENQRNLFLTIALSILILVGWQVFFMQPRIDAERERLRVEQELQQQQQNPAGTPQGFQTPGVAAGTVPGSAPAGAAAVLTREEALKQFARVVIDTPKLSGSVNLKGGRIDDLRLKDYHETVDKTSPLIELLSPSGLP